jgi:hypothetical protein
MSEEILFSQLVIGERYKFLWGPHDLLLSGVCIVNTNRNGIADFSNSYNEEDKTIVNDDGITASAGPFFLINT